MVVLLLALCALVLALPGAAHAGTARLMEKGSPWGSGRIDDLVYRAGADENNRLAVTFTAEGVQVVDSAGVTAGRHCARVNRRAVRCTSALGIDQVVASLGDRDDRARIGSYRYSYTAVLDGGSGADVLVSRSRFRDLFIGGPGNDTMTGVAFAEVFDEGVRANGRDTMRTYYPPGGGWAWVDYGKRVRPVEADLDGARDDGEEGERDLIGHGVTALRGSSKADRLSGDGRGNDLVGSGGADVLIGRGGNDALIATEVGPPAREAGEGVPASPARDRLVGGRGEDLLEGSTGANDLDGGRGSDRILGLAGADRIHARDGDVDRIECGTEDDHAWKDVIDFTADCERLAAFPPGAAPLSAHAVFEENRYPGDPPPRYVAQVTVGCSVGVPCTGTLQLSREKEVVGTAPFAFDAPYLYAQVTVVVSRKVAALVNREDPMISATVTTDATGVRRQASFPALGADHIPIVPIIPLIGVAAP
jgi:hemolysin type calcium-binding protein